MALSVRDALTALLDVVDGSTDPSTSVPVGGVVDVVIAVVTVEMLEAARAALAADAALREDGRGPFW